MFHCSAAEGQRFQNEVTRISETIVKLGKNPFKESFNPKEGVKNSKKKTNRKITE